jgi:KUP system potassium uptake protein
MVLLGVFATALFYGDSMITPAMSVLTAVEGLAVVNHGFAPYHPADRADDPDRAVHDPVARARQGGAAVRPDHAALFHRARGMLGIINIAAEPASCIALNPWHAYASSWTTGSRAFLAMGSVVLAVTGAEALYADMGHFGRKPIGLAGWSSCCPR